MTGRLPCPKSSAIPFKRLASKASRIEVNFLFLFLKLSVIVLYFWALVSALVVNGHVFGEMPVFFRLLALENAMLRAWGLV